jgi:UDP-N-acetylmuramoyl-tripeptide--D-alanyl-D-alanine ligase
MPTFDPNLLAQWTGGRWLSDAPSSIRGVAIDSRSLTPGNVFVAIRGGRFDGHVFVRQALAHGAAAAIVRADSLPAGVVGPLLCVPDTARALRDMAAAYRRMLGLKVIAVTGSVGKTTVKEMVADVLAHRFATARTCGNWNNDIGLPLSLLNMDASTRVGVFEIGANHPGELMPLCRILQPDWGIVTMIAPVHMEYFKSMEGVVDEKSSLLKCLPPDGMAILRSDEPWFKRLRALAPDRVITVALSGEADYLGVPACAWDGEAAVTERASGERMSFRMPLPGPHHLINAMFAVAIGRAYGMTWDDIRHPLEAYASQPMRWECQSLDGITVVNDAYNANPVSMAAALRTFADMPVAGRKWLVLAGMLELGSEEALDHQALGGIVAQGTWGGLIVVGDFGNIIAAGAEKAGMPAARIFRCRDHAGAAQQLMRYTAAGDAVLLKASRGQRLERVLALWKQDKAACGRPVSVS